MSDRETLADRLYRAVVQPEMTWWDDLTPEMQGGWLRGADVAEAASLDGLTVERLERAMPGYHGVMTQHAIAVALLAALRKGETK